MANFISLLLRNLIDFVYKIASNIILCTSFFVLCFYCRHSNNSFSSVCYYRKSPFTTDTHFILFFVWVVVVVSRFFVLASFDSYGQLGLWWNAGASDDLRYLWVVLFSFFVPSIWFILYGLMQCTSTPHRNTHDVIGIENKTVNRLRK